MSSIRLMFKLFRSNLRATASYLITLVLAVAVYYDFAILKYSPEVLGGGESAMTVVICAALMSVVMVAVFFGFVWSSSRFFLEQRKKEIGLYALCGVPMRRVGRVFQWDALLTGLLALLGGLALGMLLTKLFLMGAALMIRVEKPMAFALPLPAVIETAALVGVIFLAVAVRNALVAGRSKLIDLLQGMRAAEAPPKRRAPLVALAVLALTSGYWLSVYVSAPGRLGMILFACIPILLLVIAGSYWAFAALMPWVLERLSQNKAFFYRGMRMVGISNLWYRLRTNHRNLALTSVLSATAIVTLCVALTISDYVGAREGRQSQRLVTAYSFSAWMAPEDVAGVEALLNQNGVEPSEAFFIPAARVAGSVGDGFDKIVLEQAEARAAAARLMPALNLPVPKISVPAGGALEIIDPDVARMFSVDDARPPLRVGGRILDAEPADDLWLWGGNSALGSAVIVPDGYLSGLPEGVREPRVFLGLQVDDKTAEALLGAIEAEGGGVTAELNRQLTTEARVLYGTLSYLGLIMFGVFSLLTGCALLFKQLSEAAADRLKYQCMIHVGATRAELARAVGWQVGLSLVVPMLLGFVHALFAVRVMGMVFALPTMGYLLSALMVYALVVLALCLLTVNRFMKIIA